MATVDPNEPTELTGEDKHYQDLLAAGLVGEDDKPAEDASEGGNGTPDTEADPEAVGAEKPPEHTDTPAEAAAAEEFLPRLCQFAGRIASSCPSAHGTGFPRSGA